jgi:preprotein translocase subunit SecA
MIYTELFQNINRYYRRLTGCTIEYDLTAYRTFAEHIKKQAVLLRNEKDGTLRERAESLRTRARSGESHDSLLIDVYALVHEAIFRTLAITPFEVQLIGAVALHKGKLAEMQTGEGKTLTAVFPAVLNALGGKGVHMLTFNDYLARRDASWMGPVYSYLGLTVGAVQEEMSGTDRKKAYEADVTYLTAKESGFDFLRDGLCYEPGQIVQRPFHYAIIDEADSILIDESRHPLIIAGAEESDSGKESEKTLSRATLLASELNQGEDFEFDTYARNIYLTESGIRKVESILGCGNLYDDRNFELLSSTNYALHAEYLLLRDKDYIIRNGKVEMVDEFTGRVADKRRWPDGLQRAVEAKENCLRQSKGTILNSIPLQHFLQLYPRLCGMTATAQAAEEEFRAFYNLHIVAVPPNLTCVRQDFSDIVFRTKKEKHDAVIDEILRVHATGRPVLAGTTSVAESAFIAEEIRKRGVQCEVLNAKRNAYEASIIAQAGKIGAITISTNMAGRGTDIKLGGVNETGKEQIMNLGGLYVIGTNRHESRRIDNQLRGRAARQGDPGSSQFFISCEDDLFRKYRLADLLPSRFVSEHDNRVDSPFVKKEIDRVQRIIEGQNLEIKISLCRYSFIVEQQRRILYDKRREILSGTSIFERFRETFPEDCGRMVESIGLEQAISFCRQTALNHLDISWSHYLSEIGETRDGIHLRRLGKQDPLYEFQKIAIEMFTNLLEDFEKVTWESLKSACGEKNVIETRMKAPSATWTYLVNDDPWEDKFEMKFIGDIGFSFGAALQMPLLLLYFAMKKLRKKNKGDSL